MLREHLPEDLLGVGDGLLWKVDRSIDGTLCFRDGYSSEVFVVNWKRIQREKTYLPVFGWVW